MNRHVVLGPSMAAAYAPQAEGEAEGMRVYEMGAAYAEQTQGEAEGMRVDQLGDINPNSAEAFRAYQFPANERRMMRGVQPACLSVGSGGRMGDTRMEWFNAHPMVRGLRESDADLALRGLREEDANLTLRGLRETDSDLALRGLREEDSNLALRGVDGLEGNELLRYRSMGDGLLNYRNMGGARGGQGAQMVAEGSAEGTRMEQLGAQTMRRHTHLLTEESRLMGLRESDASLSLSGVEGMRAAIMLRGLREEDAGLTLRGLREEDARLTLKGADQLGYIPQIVNLNEYKRLGEQNILDYRRMGAEDFHRRFPVDVQIQGIGRVCMTKDMARVAGIFDFLKANPTWDEFVGRCKTVLAQWNPLKARMEALPDQQKAALSTQLAAMDRVSPNDYDQLNGYIMDPTGYTIHATGRTHELERLETALPTIQKMVAQMEQLGPQANLKSEINKANQTAKDDVNSRLSNVKPDVLKDYVLPGFLGAGLITGLVLIIA